MQYLIWIRRLGLVAIFAVVVTVMLSAITGAQYGPAPPTEHPGIPEPPGIPDRPGSPTEPLTITVSAPDVCEVRRPLQSIHTVIHAQDASGNRPDPTVTRYWPWDGGGTMEVSWEVSGGEPPYYVLINGQPVDGASGTVELSCAMSHGVYQSHPVHGRTVAEAPLTDSGVLEIEAEVSDQSLTGGRAKATTKTYALLSADHDHTLRGGQTYRIAGRLMTIPEGMAMQMGDYLGLALQLHVVRGEGPSEQRPWIMVKVAGHIDYSEPWWEAYEQRRWLGDGRPFASATALGEQFDRLLASRNGWEAINKSLDRAADASGVRAAGHDSGAPGSSTNSVVLVPTNGNLIGGQTTLLCTTEASLFKPLKRAVKAWNDELEGLLGAVKPLTVHTKPDGSMPGECQDDSGNGGLDIHVLVTREGHCANACHSQNTGVDGRRTFRRVIRNASGQIVEEYPYARITYRSEVVRHETMMHELGQTLGLPDYRDDDPDSDDDEGCEALWGSADPATDVDRRDDDLSLMRNLRSAECRSGGVVTGRDRRDLFEVYYPAPPLDVETSYDHQTQTVEFFWTGLHEDETAEEEHWGLRELARQADQVGLFGRSDDGSWELLGATDISGEQNTIELALAEGRRGSYMVVGLTQARLNTLLGWGPQLDTHGGDQYTLGEPLLASRVVTADGDALELPLRLTAGVTPASCYVTGIGARQELQVNWWTPEELSGVDVELTLAGVELTDSSAQCRDISDSGQDNVVELVVRAEQQVSGQTRVTELSLDVADREYDVPPNRAISFFIDARTLPSPVECEVGQNLLGVAWWVDPASASDTVEYWIQNELKTGTSGSVVCPLPANGRIVGFALLPDGSGLRDDKTISTITIPDLDMTKNQVTATDESASSVKLSWASTTNEMESAFELKCWEVVNGARSHPCPGFANQDTDPRFVRMPDTERIVTGLRPFTAYEFALRARYGSDEDASGWLEGIDAHTPPGTPGTAPVVPPDDSPGGVPPDSPPEEEPEKLDVNLSIKEHPASCEVDGSVTLFWQVTNAGALAEVSAVDSGDPDNTIALPATAVGEHALACAKPYGARTITVTVKELAPPQNTVSGTTSYTVLVPEITVTGQVAARKSAADRVEFGFRPEGETIILPANRFVTPSEMGSGWRWTSAVLMTIDEDDEEQVNIGAVWARKRQDSDGTNYFEVCFRWSDDAWHCPTARRFEYEDAEIGSWHYSGSFTRTFRPGAGTGAASLNESVMDGAAANEPNPSYGPERALTAAP